MSTETLSYAIEHGAIADCPVWESHKRGKNWLAIISANPRAPAGLERNFQERAHGDDRYMVNKLKRGDAIEFGADYYSGSGKKHGARWYGVVVSISDTEIHLQQYGTGKEAIKAAADLTDEDGAQAKQAAITRIRELMAQHGITINDINKEE